MLEPGGSRFAGAGHEVALAVPGRAQRAQRGRGAGGGRAGRAPTRPRAVAALAGFAGAGRRFERLGRTRGRREVVDDYAHHPTEVAATIAAARTLGAAAGGRGLPAAPVLPHRAAAPRVRRRAGRRRRGRACSTSTRRASAPRTSRASAACSIAEAAADAAGGPDGDVAAERSTTPSAVLAPRLRDGDLVLVLGAGDVDASAARWSPPDRHARPGTTCRPEARVALDGLGRRSGVQVSVARRRTSQRMHRAAATSAAPRRPAPAAGRRLGPRRPRPARGGAAVAARLVARRRAAGTVTGLTGPEAARVSAAPRPPRPRT